MAKASTKSGHAPELEPFGFKKCGVAPVRALVGFLQRRKGVDFRICHRHGRFAGVGQVESDPYQITNL